MCLASDGRGNPRPVSVTTHHHTMAERLFRADGIAWIARDVPAGATYSPDPTLAGGWLRFESKEVRLWLPAPRDWSTLPDADLRVLLTKARPPK